MQYTVFVADMHLSARTTYLNRLFATQLSQWKGEADALYLLGDVFDVWIGDDGTDESVGELLAAMHAFAQHTPLWVMHGNRDFLMGAEFERCSGAVLLDEPHLANVYGKKYLLCHGDALCTDDVAYQQFRAQSRHPAWQAAVLAKPFAERKMLAEHIRSLSEHKKGDAGQYEISDVTETGLQALQAEFADQGAPFDVIHGHTHRPCQHQHLWQGQAYRRFVLQDWHHGQGGCIKIFADGQVTTESF